MSRWHALLFLAWTACGSRTSLDLGPGLGAEPLDAGVAQVPSHDAAMSRDVGIATDAAPPPGTRFGVAVGSGTLAGLSGPDTAQVYFYPQEEIAPACAFVGASGTCGVVTCPTSQALPPSANAGTVVASVGTASTMLPYAGTSPNGTYEGGNIDAIFTTGSTMTFQGPGGPDVPPFEVSATAPNLVQLDPPWFTTEVTIDTTQDLPVSWGAAPTGDAVFSVGDAYGHELICFFEGSEGTAVVPQGDLAELKSLLAGAPANAEFFVATRVGTTVPGWQIEEVAMVWAGATVSQYGAVILQ